MANLKPKKSNRKASAFRLARSRLKMVGFAAANYGKLVGVSGTDDLHWDTRRLVLARANSPLWSLSGELGRERRC